MKDVLRRAAVAVDKARPLIASRRGQRGAQPLHQPRVRAFHLSQNQIELELRAVVHVSEAGKTLGGQDGHVLLQARVLPQQLDQVVRNLHTIAAALNRHPACVE